MRTSTVRAYDAFQYRDFRFYLIARLTAMVAMQMQSVAVGWQVYEMTRDPLDLGLVGLSQFLPVPLLALFAGHASDRFERQKISFLCLSIYALCSFALLGITFRGISSTPLPMYLILFCVGISRAFIQPANQSLLPHLLPQEHFQNAVAWNTSSWQLGMILGPAIGGLIYSIFHSPGPVYLASLSLFIVAALATSQITFRMGKKEPAPFSFDALFAGIRYVWKKQLLFSAISLDLFAVLLGGATALLPAFARDVLHAGPQSLGWLRSGPALGASIMAIWMAYHPIQNHAGRKMLIAALAFGIFTIGFGLSNNFYMALFFLIFLGAADMVSVLIRHTLLQLATPGEMRGRVSAVNSVFIGASNELGEFESGITAAWFGLVPAIVYGGIGTCMIVVVWALLFPSLRKVNQLAPHNL